MAHEKVFLLSKRGRYYYDADAIRNIEAGKVQLSCGYSCDFDPTPGEIDGEKYDGIQRNI
ncbi:hypothetical protein LCGC14_2367830, partial [marine sediment metagenome]